MENCCRGLGVGDYSFPVGLSPFQYTVFEHQMPDELLFFDDGRNRPADRMSVIVSGDQASIESFHTIAACFSANLGSINHAMAVLHEQDGQVAPIASVIYTLGSTTAGDKKFQCSDQSRDSISEGKYVFMNNEWYPVGYVDENLHFRSLDPEVLQRELADQHRPINVDLRGLSQALQGQEAFRKSMRTILPTCQDAGGKAFTSVFPIVDDNYQ